MENERVLYEGRVHWITYVPGFVYLVLAVLLAKLLYSADAIPAIYTMARFIEANAKPLLYLPQAIAILLFALGIYRLVKAYLIAYFTELVVTNFRVIAKFGVYETTTIEMDRHKIAGVVVHQSINGKIFGYGLITLRGFAGNITGLPVLKHPYEFQKHVTGPAQYYGV
jgi:hypothetical protein